MGSLVGCSESDSEVAGLRAKIEDLEEQLEEIGSEEQQLEPALTPTAIPSTPTAIPPSPTAIPMHADWTADNIYEFMRALAGDWPFNAQDYYSDRIYNDCGGRRFTTESTFRHYQYQGAPDLRVTDVRIYLNKYVAEVEWYYKGGSNRDSTVYFEVVDRSDYRSAKYRRPYSFRLDSYWPSGMEDFC